MGWVVVITRPAAEEVAARALRTAGYRSYLPMYRKRLLAHGMNRRPAAQMRPLFTGYVLVQDWRGWPQLTINGVVGLLRLSSGKLAVLPDADVVLMWQAEMRGAFDEARAMEPGDTVTFELGGEQILAILDEITETGRGIVRNIVGIERSWSIPVDMLDVASA